MLWCVKIQLRGTEHVHDASYWALYDHCHQMTGHSVAGIHAAPGARSFCYTTEQVAWLTIQISGYFRNPPPPPALREQRTFTNKEWCCLCNFWNRGISQFPFFVYNENQVFSLIWG